MAQRGDPTCPGMQLAPDLKPTWFRNHVLLSRLHSLHRAVFDLTLHSLPGMVTVVDSISSLQTWALPEQQLAQRHTASVGTAGLDPRASCPPGLQESIHLVPPCLRTQRRAGMVPVLRVA